PAHAAGSAHPRSPPRSHKPPAAGAAGTGRPWSAGSTDLLFDSRTSPDTTRACRALDTRDTNQHQRPPAPINAVCGRPPELLRGQLGLLPGDEVATPVDWW